MIIVICILGELILLFSGYYTFCVAQHKGYRVKEILSGGDKLIKYDVVSFILSFIGLIGLLSSGEKYILFGFLGLIPSIAFLVVKIIRFQVSLRFTKRIVRTYIVYLVLTFLPLISVFFLDSFVLLIGSWSSLSFPLVLLSCLILSPVERANNKRFIDRCRDRLSLIGPKVIAVTGSAGKTSVKRYLSKLLSEKWVVYSTPQSYNTPLGIAKAVSKMPENTDIFIAEFGSRHEGDILELIKIVSPDIGVLTTVLPQHLETFGNIRNVAKEKLTLLDSTPIAFAFGSDKTILSSNGFIDGDLQDDDANIEKSTINEFVSKERRISPIDGDSSKRRSSLFPPHTRLFSRGNITGLHSSLKGISFDYHYKDKSFRVESSLVGDTNIDNLILSIGIALELGISIEYIQKQVLSLKSPPHRMEIFTNEGGIKIIDDSYNINPIGAKNALHALKLHDGRKIVTCSGFVELASSDHIYEFADELVKCADIVIILGDINRKALTMAIGDRITTMYAKNIEECKKLYATILKKGDCLLILADIPEEYGL